MRTPAERRRARRRLTAGRYGYVVLFLSPWIIGFVLFTAWPMLLSLYYSFTSYDLLTKPRWVGLDNYRFMFGVGTISVAVSTDCPTAASPHTASSARPHTSGFITIPGPPP